MPATFDPDLGTHKDHIRLAVGDIHDGDVAGTITNPLLQDGVIEAKLNEFGYREALAQVLEYLIARYGIKPTDHSVDGVSSVTWGDRLESWQTLLKNARGGLTQAPGETAPRRNMAIGQLSTPANVRLISDLPE